MDIASQLRARYASLNKARRKIADCVLNYPEKCSFLSLKDLAELAGVTEVTVLSFCRDMGFQSYSDFRRELQDDLVATVEIRERMKLLHNAGKSDSALYEQLARSSRQIIESTYAGNDIGVILQFTAKLAGAKHILIAAHNITEKHARSFASRLLYQGIDTHCLDIQDRESIFSLMTMWPSGDCLLLAFGISPIGKSTLAIVDLASRLGIEIISVTDKATSQLARSASVSLLCNVRMMNLYNSSVTIFLMLDVVAAFLSVRMEGLPSPSGRSAQELNELRQAFVQFSTLE